MLFPGCFSRSPVAVSPPSGDARSAVEGVDAAKAGQLGRNSLGDGALT